MPQPVLDLGFVRGLYPAPCWSRAFFENAGGSYVPESVIGRTTAYMRESQVQPGANFDASALAAKRINDGQRVAAQMIGAETDEVIIGPSTTMSPVQAEGMQMRMGIDEPERPQAWRT